jgi:hypothetical protein
MASKSEVENLKMASKSDTGSAIDRQSDNDYFTKQRMFIF